MRRRRLLQLGGVLAAGVGGIATVGRQAWPVMPSSTDPTPRAGALWLHLRPDGRLTVLCPVHELGQGSSIALAQIAAEEMGLDLQHIDLRLPTSRELAPMRMTTGSRAIATHARPMARAAAALRETLRARAASRLGLPTERITHVDGGFAAPDGRVLDLASLAEGQPVVIDPDRMADPQLYTFSTGRPRRVVGRSVAPTQAEDLVRGHAAFAADVHLPDMAYGRVVQPPWPGARLLGVDADAVRRLPGVVAAVVDLGVGLAGIVAETPGALDRAMERLEPRWAGPPGAEPVPAAMAPDIDAALRRGPLGHVLVDEGASAQGTWSLDLRLDLPALHHAALEPRCAVARFGLEQGQALLELWVGSQDSRLSQRCAASALGWPEDRVLLHRMRVGGAFGGRAQDDVARDAWQLARAVGRPVKVQWSRADEFIADRLRPPSSHRVRLEANPDGRLMRWWHAAVSAPMLLTEGLAPPWALPALRHWVADFGAARGLLAPYSAEQRRIEFDSVPLPLHTGAWRSLGATPNNFAIESAIDEAARRLGLDPVQMRLKNLGPRHERLAACLRRVRQRTEALSLPMGPGFGRGYACGTYHDHSHVAVSFDVQVLRAEGRVKALRACCVQDCGLLVHPDQVRAQIEGNLVMAIGQVLIEQARFDRAGTQARRWADYPIAALDDTPEFDIELIDDGRHEPAGVGEVALIAAVPALANALRDASGWRPNRLPFAMSHLSGTG